MQAPLCVMLLAVFASSDAFYGRSPYYRNAKRLEYEFERERRLENMEWCCPDETGFYEEKLCYRLPDGRLKKNCTSGIYVRKNSNTECKECYRVPGERCTQNSEAELTLDIRCARGHVCRHMKCEGVNEPRKDLQNLLTRLWTQDNDYFYDLY